MPPTEEDSDDNLVFEDFGVVGDASNCASDDLAELDSEE